MHDHPDPMSCAQLELAATLAHRASSPPAESLRGRYSWLRPLISRIDVGYSTIIDPKKIARLNSRQDVINRRMVNWKNEMFYAHERGSEIYFFCAGTGPQMLIGLDIDCHAEGDLDGAMAAAKYLRDLYLPGLHYEPSTTHTGVHGYVIVDRQYESLRDVTRFLRRDLGSWLTRQVHDEGFSVEMIEIVGTPTYCDRDTDGRPVDVRFGQLCKVPRRMDACRDTTRIAMSELRELVESTPAPRTPNSTACRITKAKPRGSIAGHLIAADAVAHALPLAQQCIDMAGPIETACESSISVTDVDVAQFFVVAMACTDRSNADGSMPMARIRAWSEACYDTGTFSRQYHPSRAAAIRNRLADLGLLDVISDRYAVPAIGIHDPSTTAPPRKGIAMRWGLTDQATTILTHPQPESSMREILGISSLSGPVTFRPVRVSMRMLERAHGPPGIAA